MDSRRAGGGNRMMTSTTLQTNDIWSKTIGHDPHAGDAEAAEDAAARERQEERARGVMELARLDAIKQGGSSRGDNFAQSLFWGLKRKAPPRGYEMAPVESSSPQHVTKLSRLKAQLACSASANACVQRRLPGGAV